MHARTAHEMFRLATADAVVVAFGLACLVTMLTGQPVPVGVTVSYALAIPWAVTSSVPTTIVREKQVLIRAPWGSAPGMGADAGTCCWARSWSRSSAVSTYRICEEEGAAHQGTGRVLAPGEARMMISR